MNAKLKRHAVHLPVMQTRFHLSFFVMRVQVQVHLQVSVTIEYNKEYD